MDSEILPDTTSGRLTASVWGKDEAGNDAWVGLRIDDGYEGSWASMTFDQAATFAKDLLNALKAAGHSDT